MSDNARILYVDDKSSNLYSVKEIFEDSDITCDCLQESERVFKILTTTQYDLLILDIQMPHKDGFELARDIKADTRFREMPILFLTAEYSTTDSIMRGLDMGAEDYLTKPIDPSILLKKVEISLSKRTGKEELERKNDKYKRFFKNIPRR